MKKNIFALDLGTTKFCLASLQLDFAATRASLDWVAVPAAGMKNGMLERLDHASAQISLLVGRGEDHFGTTLSQVVVGIAGQHLASHFYECGLELAGSKVLPRHIAKLSGQSSEEKPTEQRETILRMPLAYQVDTRPWCASPLGLSGDALQGSFFTVTADKHYLRDVVSLCNSAGLKIAKFFPEPVASATSILESSPYKQGVVVIDMGGGSIDGVAYRHSLPIFVFTLQGGGVGLTEAIGYHWNLSAVEAERVKREVGFASGQIPAKIECFNLHGERQMICTQAVGDLLMKAFSKLARELSRVFEDLGYPEHTGLVVTGGGAELKGCTEVLSKMLGRPVSKLGPHWKSALPGSLQATGVEFTQPADPANQHATAVGLLLLAAQLSEQDQNARGSSEVRRGVRRVFGWLRDLS